MRRHRPRRQVRGAIANLKDIVVFDAGRPIWGKAKFKTGSDEIVLDAIEVLALEAPVKAAYGALRNDLERAGQPIGANDLLIAAHALTLGHTLVTDNERAFSKLGDLRVENWLR